MGYIYHEINNIYFQIPVCSVDSLLVFSCGNRETYYEQSEHYLRIGRRLVKKISFTG